MALKAAFCGWLRDASLPCLCLHMSKIGFKGGKYIQIYIIIMSLLLSQSQNAGGVRLSWKRDGKNGKYI